MSSKETALLFGGCFWGIQDLVRRLPSVNSTRVGYSDVANAYATHRNHGTHGEALEVVFGPARTSWRALLEFFFLIHNPSTPNRQGNDGGCYYRSGIYYKTPEHRQITLETIADVDASGLWPGKMVTGVEPAGPFWQAEPAHEDYLQRNLNGYTCRFPPVSQRAVRNRSLTQRFHDERPRPHESPAVASSAVDRCAREPDSATREGRAR